MNSRFLGLIFLFEYAPLKIFQFDSIGALRSDFYFLVQSHQNDFAFRLKALSLLTRGGRMLDPFADSLGRLLVAFIRDNEMPTHDKIQSLAFLVRSLSYREIWFA